MDMLHLEHQDGVAVVRLSHGVTNAINLPLVDELAGVVRQVKRDVQMRGLVLGSANDRFFSIGLNLPELYDLPSGEIAAFFRAFSQACLDLYILPKPTVAAITGHALAGGCIVALCCDYRYIAEGRKLMGLNEVQLGLSVPYLADCILRHLVGIRHAREITDTGALFPPEESLRRGLVDRVLPLEEVLPQAIEKGRELGALPPGAFAAIKRNRVAPIEAEVLAHREERDQVLGDLWHTDETRTRLKAALERF